MTANRSREGRAFVEFMDRLWECCVNHRFRRANPVPGNTGEWRFWLNFPVPPDYPATIEATCSLECGRQTEGFIDLLEVTDAIVSRLYGPAGITNRSASGSVAPYGSDVEPLRVLWASLVGPSTTAVPAEHFLRQVLTAHGYDAARFAVQDVAIKVDGGYLDDRWPRYLWAVASTYRRVRDT